MGRDKVIRETIVALTGLPLQSVLGFTTNNCIHGADLV